MPVNVPVNVATSENVGRPVDVGVQLYSVRDSLARDPEGTLRALAEIGFTRVEGANHGADSDAGIGFGISAELLRRVTDETGLSIVGCHINPLRLERLPEVLDFHASIDNPGIGCDIEFYDYGDVGAVLRRAETFNEVGRLCAERGMDFYYHNHFQEFQEFDGRTVYELILDNTDPELVSIEMDTYWVYRGGHDPLEWMARYPDRVVLVHQKDFPADAPQPLNLYDGVVDPKAPIDMALFERVLAPTAFTEIGTGTLPIQQIVDRVSALPNFRHLLLEQDFSRRDELESVAISRTNLDRYAGVRL